MSLHEYIDIPLEGSVSARATSPPPAPSPHHPPPVAARLFKEWLGSQRGARMNTGARISRRERARKGIGKREGGRGVTWHCADGSRMLDSGM